MFEQAVYIIALLVIALFCLMILYYALKAVYYRFTHKPIKIGIIHSLSGDMAISERAVADAMLLAVDELNARGGLVGRRIKPIVVDGASNPIVFARKAEHLITKEKVCVIFGCWRSDCRKAVKSVVEKHQHLLIYPVFYEGLEESKYIVYMGLTANQQIIPTIKWAFDNLGKKFFLVGSDYIYPHTANAIMKDQIRALGGEVMGEQYVVLGSKYVDHITRQISEKNPDVIINTINGDTNVHFFKSLRSMGITSESIPTISFSIGEVELSQMDANLVEGDYAAWSYFQSIPSYMNRLFIENYKAKYGRDKVTSNSIDSGYISVMLWAKSVKEMKTVDTHTIRKSICNQFIYGTSGRVAVDPESNHVAKNLRIGKINKDLQFDIIWSSERVIPASPYPEFRTKQQWQEFTDALYHDWGQQWLKSPNK